METRKLKLIESGTLLTEFTILDDGTVKASSSSDFVKPDPTEIVESPIPPLHERYLVESKVGVGGMAEVWSAFDRELGRTVAIKVSKFGSPPVLREEGLLIASLQHPNIIPIYDIGQTEDGRVFYVMKLFEGRTLEDVLTRGEWTAARLLDALRQVCQGIHYANSHKIVHRDLKPSNIIVGDYGEVFVSDWGIARNFSREYEEPGYIRGTPGYLAPEQLLGEVQGGDPLTDVFSLGCCLYRAVTGMRAYQSSVEDVVGRFVRKEFARVPSYVPEELAAIVHGAIEPRRSNRTQTAGDLAQQIERYQDGAREKAARHARAMAIADRARDATAKLARRDTNPTSHVDDPVEEIMRLEKEHEAEREFQRDFAAATGLWTHVLQEEPDNSMASHGLASLYWERAVELERAGRLRESVLLDGMARQVRPDLIEVWDKPSQLTVLGHGWVRIETLEDYPIKPSRLVWEGEIPSRVDLPRGEYRVILTDRGMTTKHVIRVERGGSRTIAARYATVPDGFQVIDQGHHWFAMAILPVTVREYLVFVNESGGEDHVPKLADGRAYFEMVEGEWRLPETDADGDPWDLDWPALLVSFEDASAYIAWLAMKGIPARLPTEEEWEFGARGESKRPYPWGTSFHAGFSVLRGSDSSKRPSPSSVFEEFKDVSPFGLRFLAGNIFNLTSSKRHSMPIFKGASYNSMNEFARIESEGSLGPSERFGHIGFRIVLSLPEEGTPDSK